MRKGYEFGKGSEGHVKGSEGHVKGSENHVIPEIKITSEYIYSEGFLNSLIGSPESFNKFRLLFCLLLICYCFSFSFS